MTEQGGAGVSPHDRYLSQSADRFLRGTLECLLANRTGLERAVS